MGFWDDLQRRRAYGETATLRGRYGHMGPSGEGVPLHSRPQREFVNSRQVTLTPVPVILAAYNPFRDAILITNPSFANDVLIGNFNLNATNGKRILPRDSLSLPTTAEIWGMVEVGTLTVTWVETTIAPPTEG